MVNYLPKKKRAVYEREFTLKHVLQNLQGYRLATGDVDSQKLDVSRQNHGDDEGRVYGALIEGAGEISSKRSRTNQEKFQGIEPKRRKRRKRRKHKRLATDCGKDSSFKGASLQSKNEASNPADISEVPCPGSSSLRILAAYSSEGEGDSSSDGHSELRADGKEEDQVAKTVEERLPVPPVIHAMFEKEETSQSEEKLQSNEVARTSFWDSGDVCDNLGYFDADDMTSEEERSPPNLETVQSKNLEACELTSYTCWKCSNVGHLPQDCTVQVSKTAGLPGACRGKGVSTKVKISKSLQGLYAICREIKAGRKGQSCAECGTHSNLACCLDCRSVLCDGRGHLASHLLSHTSHKMLFSFKLGRLVRSAKF